MTPRLFFIIIAGSAWLFLTEGGRRRRNQVMALLGRGSTGADRGDGPAEPLPFPRPQAQGAPPSAPAPAANGSAGATVAAPAPQAAAATAPPQHDGQIERDAAAPAVPAAQAAADAAPPAPWPAPAAEGEVVDRPSATTAEPAPPTASAQSGAVEVREPSAPPADQADQPSPATDQAKAAAPKVVAQEPSPATGAADVVVPETEPAPAAQAQSAAQEGQGAIADQAESEQGEESENPRLEEVLQDLAAEMETQAIGQQPDVRVEEELDRSTLQEIGIPPVEQPVAEQPTASEAPRDLPPAGDQRWVGNRRTMVAHAPGAGRLPAEANRVYFADRQEAEAAGYRILEHE